MNIYTTSEYRGTLWRLCVGCACASVIYRMVDPDDVHAQLRPEIARRMMLMVLKSLIDLGDNQAKLIYDRVWEYGL